MDWRIEVQMFVVTGSILGAVVGVLHAIQLYRERVSSGHCGRACALWYAAWAIALWTLFGAYVLAFWLIGALGLAWSRLRGTSQAGR